MAGPLEGKVVIVGRGGNLILPGGDGVRVRLVALEEHRIAALVEREGLSLEAAVQALKKQDADRADFIRRHFRVDSNDPTRFDMVLNLSTIGMDTAVDLICQAARRT